MELVFRNKDEAKKVIDSMDVTTIKGWDFTDNGGVILKLFDEDNNDDDRDMGQT